MQVQKFSRCVRAQHRFKTSAVGYPLTKAAKRTNTRFGMANGSTVRQGGSDIDALSDAQGIFKFYAKIPNSTVDLCVAE